MKETFNHHEIGRKETVHGWETGSSYKQVTIKQDIPLDSVVMRLSERSVRLIIHKRRYGSDDAPCRFSAYLK
jgi:ferredoxin-thioredoxin reductase catalytic subunit